ncbi:MAG: nucleoside kinase, partial [Kibdelosporangium sp.]
MACGVRMDVPVVPADEAVVVCEACGHRQPFLRLPMFALTGPSGTGKSTVSRMLAGELGGAVVVLEQDVLWTAGLRDPYHDFQLFRAT